MDEPNMPRPPLEPGAKSFTMMDFVGWGLDDVERTQRAIDCYWDTGSFLDAASFHGQVSPEEYLALAISNIDDFNLRLSRAVAFLKHCPPAALEFYAHVASEISSHEDNTIEDYENAQSAAMMLCERASQLFGTTYRHSTELAGFVNQHRDTSYGQNQLGVLMVDFLEALENTSQILKMSKIMLYARHPNVGYVADIIESVATWVEQDPVPYEYYDVHVACAFHFEARNGLVFHDDGDYYSDECGLNIREVLERVAKDMPRVNAFLGSVESEFSIFDNKEERPTRENPRTKSFYAGESSRLCGDFPLWNSLIYDNNTTTDVTLDALPAAGGIIPRGDTFGFDDPRLVPTNVSSNHPSVHAGLLMPKHFGPRDEVELGLN